MRWMAARPNVEWRRFATSSAPGREEAFATANIRSITRSPHQEEPMCGIVGLWNVTHERPLLTVSAMLDAMQHRGPDGRGTLEYIGGAAGMVRLALVDLSNRGLQPIWSDDRRVAILFNGEMYNFRT